MKDLQYLCAFSGRNDYSVNNSICNALDKIHCKIFFNIFHDYTKHYLFS